MQTAIEWVIEHWKFVALVGGLFVEFTPAIKFSPIKSILKWIGAAINGDLSKQLSEIETRLNDQRKSIDENELDRIRWEVLDFANACRNNRRHTKDEFEHIIDINTKYHELLDKYGKKNGVFDMEYNYILELYQRCQHENDFL